MLTLFLSLVDRLIKLTELREAGARRRFVDHVEPIFRDLRSVYDDYRNILSMVLTQLSDPATPIESIASDLRSHREKNLRLRDELRRYSGALRNAPDSEITGFVAAALKLLRMEPTTPDDDRFFESVDSPIYSVLHRVEELAVSPADLFAQGIPDTSRQELLALVSGYETRINRAWEDLSRLYYQLRSTSLK